MALEVWMVPANDVYETDAYDDDVYIAITKDEQRDPVTFGTYFVGHADKLVFEEYARAWLRMVEQQHDYWEKGE